MVVCITIPYDYKQCCHLDTTMVGTIPYTLLVLDTLVDRIWLRNALPSHDFLWQQRLSSLVSQEQYHNIL